MRERGVLDRLVRRKLESPSQDRDYICSDFDHRSDGSASIGVSTVASAFYFVLGGIVLGIIVFALERTLDRRFPKLARKLRRKFKFPQGKVATKENYGVTTVTLNVGAKSVGTQTTDLPHILPFTA